MTEPTRQLLITEFDADLPNRQNLIPIPVGSSIDVEGSFILLLPADHMLGSVQVSVHFDNGLRLGYSGDFHWPLDEIIQVDELVLDSTYGSPRCVRMYSQEEAEGRLLELVRTRVKNASIHIKAHRGTLHRAMQVLRSGSLQSGCF